VQSGEGVIANVRNHEDDTSYEINADFLIACDGAGSAVRHQCGIEMLGPRSLQHWATVVLQADFRHLVKANPGLLYWTYGADRTGLFIAYDIDDRWVYMHACEEGQEITDEQPEQWVRSAIGDDTPFKIVHTDRWSMSAQVAQHFRDGRIFLAGDAAHRFPPTGGMGMNTGMQDVFNLCWKIARVVNGDSALALLDSYELERRPSVERNCEQSRVNFEKMSQVEEAIGISSNVEKTRENLNLLDIDDINSQQRRDKIQQSIDAQRDHFFMLGMDLGVCYDGALIQTCPEDAPENNWQASEYNPSSAAGNRLPHCWLQDGDTRLSTHDIVASVKLTLLTTSDGYQQWAQALADTGTDDIEIQAIGNAGLAPADDGWDTLIGMKQHGALLIRPDRHIAFGTDHFSENTCKDIFRLLQNYRGENNE
jgi:2,4-dichlorophenol 6-monooxygenase